MMMLQLRMQLCGDEQTGGGGGGDGGFVVMNRRIGVTVDAIGSVAVEEVHPNILCRSQLGILQVTDIRREERKKGKYEREGKIEGRKEKRKEERKEGREEGRNERGKEGRKE